MAKTFHVSPSVILIQETEKKAIRALREMREAGKRKRSCEEFEPYIHVSRSSISSVFLCAISADIHGCSEVRSCKNHPYSRKAVDGYRQPLRIHANKLQKVPVEGISAVVSG